MASEVKNNSIEKLERYLDKSVRYIWDSDYLSNYQRNSCKKSQRNTIICRFLQGISFNIERKDKENTWTI